MAKNATIKSPFDAPFKGGEKPGAGNNMSGTFSAPHDMGNGGIPTYVECTDLGEKMATTISPPLASPPAGEGKPAPGDRRDKM